jgi:hypothetical protein
MHGFILNDAMGSKRVGEVRFQAISGDHAGARIPHLHAFIGSGEVIVELLPVKGVRLGSARRADPRHGDVARSEHHPRDGTGQPSRPDTTVESEPAPMSNVKAKGRILTTQAEMRRAARDAREREKTATKMRAARYDAHNDAIVVDLSTGASLIVPRPLIRGFADASPRSLSDLAINPGRESLWSETVDDGVLLEQLVEIAAGADFLKVLGGRISGRRRSPAKAAASRANGAKGGRPPLPLAAFVAHLDQKLHDTFPKAPHAETTEDSSGKLIAGAVWRMADRVSLSVKSHGVNEVHVRAAWPLKRPVERRIRTTAERLAREFARWLVHADLEAVTHREAHALGRRAASRQGASARKQRRSSG